MHGDEKVELLVVVALCLCLTATFIEVDRPLLQLVPLHRLSDGRHVTDRRRRNEVHTVRPALRGTRFWPVLLDRVLSPLDHGYCRPQLLRLLGRNELLGLEHPQRLLADRLRSSDGQHVADRRRRNGVLTVRPVPRNPRFWPVLLDRALSSPGHGHW